MIIVAPRSADFDPTTGIKRPCLLAVMVALITLKILNHLLWLNKRRRYRCCRRRLNNCCCCGSLSSVNASQNSEYDSRQLTENLISSSTMSNFYRLRIVTKYYWTVLPLSDTNVPAMVVIPVGFDLQSHYGWEYHWSRIAATSADIQHRRPSGYKFDQKIIGEETCRSWKPPFKPNWFTQIKRYFVDKCIKLESLC